MLDTMFSSDLAAMVDDVCIAYAPLFILVLGDLGA